jgi:hypothetical protein
MLRKVTKECFSLAHVVYVDFGEAFHFSIAFTVLSCFYLIGGRTCLPEVARGGIYEVTNALLGVSVFFIQFKSLIWVLLSMRVFFFFPCN